MVDDKLATEEAQRAANYEAIKSSVKSEVGAEIAADANVPTAAEREDVSYIAGDMRQKAVDEVIQTDREVERGRSAARVSQIVDYIFFVIYGLLAIRLLLELFDARESAGFVKFIKSTTGIFYAPFEGIFGTKDGFGVLLSFVVAFVAYMLLHLAVNGLLRMFAHRKTEI